MLKYRNLKKTAAALLTACLISTTICSCGGTAGATDTESTGTSDVEKADIPYTEKEIPVFREKLTDEKVPLRFYEDQPNVPYMGIAAYYTMMIPNAEMTVERYEDGSYFLYHENGNAVIDINEETMSSDNISDFTNLMPLMQEGMPNVSLDGAPYLRFSSMSCDPKRANVTYEFADYSIDLHGGETDVFFPLATLSDMFADQAYHYSSYNGVNLYINSDNSMPEADKRDEHYYDSIAVSERPADMAAFAYHELCFAIDHFYGCPGIGYLERKGDLQKAGLDKALESLGKPGTYTRELLCSTDMADYITGLVRLGMLVGDDGGHTDLIPKTEYEELNPSLAEEMKARSDENQKGKTFFGDITELKDLEPKSGLEEDAAAMKAFREKLYGRDNTYYTAGDTAVCVLNSFDWIDYEGWKTYFAGGGELPKHDSFAIVVDAMNKAKADPAVRHFVLDLTENRGGSNDVLMGIMGLWLNKSEYTVENAVEGQKRTIRYAVDRDLNGTFDTKDADVSYNMDYAVLTSMNSYSCANLCAELMKENNIPVFGHRTAGGSCSIQKFASADGFLFNMSSALERLVDSDGSTVEGVEPDFVLSPIAEDGTVDYSEMYDFEKIGDMMEKWHQK